MNAKSTLLAVALLVFAPALHGADKNTAGYPVKLVILETNWTSNNWGIHAMGRGRIDENGQVNGVEFSYDCDHRLTVSFGGEFYPAKWKKRPNQITVMSHNIGDTHEHTCDLKLDMHDFIYVRAATGQLTTITQRQWAEGHSNGQNQPDGDKAPPQN